MSADLVYRPAFFAAAEVRYASPRHGVEETRQVTVLVPLEDGAMPFSLDRATTEAPPVDILEETHSGPAGFAPLPAEAAQPRSYDRWGRELVRWIQGACPVKLFESASLKAVSRPDESERDFRIRLADMDREARDARKERMRQKYEPRFRTLQERLRRAEQAVERRSAQSRQAMLNTGLTAIGAMLGSAGGKRKGGGLLGAFLGGSAARGTTAIRTAGRAAQSRQDVAHAAETVEAVQAAIAALEAEFAEELNRINYSAASEEPLGEVVIRPALNAISTRVTALAWLPWGAGPDGRPVALWR
jgi:hypothetical protein